MEHLRDFLPNISNQPSSSSDASTTSAVIMPTKMSLICGVCGLPTSGMNAGAVACHACKKFFLRNRNNLNKMACVMGTNDCVANNRLTATHPTFIGRSQYCCRCRLAKCFEIGMRVLQDNKQHRRQTSNSDEGSASSTTSSSPSSSSPLQQQNLCDTIVAVSSNETQMTENILRISVKAFSELSPLQKLPWSVRHDEAISGDFAMWQKAMVNFNTAVLYGLSYIRHLTEITPIAPSDKCHLFAGGFIPLVTAQVALSTRSGCTFLGMNPATKSTFLHFFPIYKMLEPDVDKVLALFEQWKPTTAELALLQAMVFFRIDTLIQLEKPDVVLEANRRLSVAITSLANQHSQSAKIRLGYFGRAFELLRAVERHYEDIVTGLAQCRSDLFHGNRLFCEMFYMSIADRQQRANYLGLKFDS